MKFDAVHLVGLGGTGSYLAAPLAKLLKYHQNGTENLHFWDKDKLEVKNLTRQDFTPESIDKNKAQEKAAELESINSNIKVHQSWFVPDTLNACLKEDPSDNLLIILAVDNDATRHHIIVELDGMLDQDFVLVLPGNGYDTGNTFWYGRQGTETAPVHPFEVADNWARPQDGLPGDCALEAVSSPQLLASNLAQALGSLLLVQGLLEDQPMPFKLDYSGPEFSIVAEGRPTYFPSLTRQPEPVVESEAETQDLLPESVPSSTTVELFS